MARQDLNDVKLTGNLTRDPEVKSNGVVTMRIASNKRRKNAQTGEWYDSPNYFDCVAFQRTGELCAQYLRKGSRVLIVGELTFREWDDAKNPGQKRSAVEITINDIEFISRADGQTGAAVQQPGVPAGVPPQPIAGQPTPGVPGQPMPGIPGQPVAMQPAAVAQPQPMAQMPAPAMAGAPAQVAQVAQVAPAQPAPQLVGAGADAGGGKLPF